MDFDLFLCRFHVGYICNIKIYKPVCHMIRLADKQEENI